MEEFEILRGLVDDIMQREKFEKALYSKFLYFIKDGVHSYSLSYDDSFSAYSDTVLTAIHNIRNGKFEAKSSLKTYLTSIFSNKCIDLARKKKSAKWKVNQSFATPELMAEMPAKVRSVVENLIKEQRIRALKENLEKIGDKCKQILLLYQDDYSDREIADKTGYNNAAVVKVTRLRCMEKLQEKMKDFIINE
jgi:RNA polymerase sigma factor (sigma-70 family)